MATMTPTAQRGVSQQGQSVGAFPPLWFEVLVVTVLLAVGVAARRRSLPVDGLVYDDAWVATGVTKGGFHDLLHVSTNHPGFSAMLMVWARTVSGRSELLAIPSFVIGAATPALTYVVLRKLRVIWSISFFAAALLLVAPPQVQYSGRVKSYVFEVVVVLVLAIALKPLASRTWSWGVAAAWLAASVLVGTFSVFTLVAVAAAGVVLALHPSGDRNRRIAAVGVQGVIQIFYFRLVQASFDSSQLTSDWSRVYDGYPEVHANPVSMVREVASHLRRFGQTLVDTGSAPALLLVVVAIAGLALSCRRGDRSLTARYLLALPILAFLGSLFRLTPFGPSVGNPLFPGGRATLWLLPSLVVGLAFSLDLIVRRLVAVRKANLLLVGVHVLAVLAAVAVVAPSLGHEWPYPLPGARSGHEAAERYAGSDDVIVLLSGMWSYSAEPGVKVAIEPRPHTIIGFVPIQLDPRVWSLETERWNGTIRQVRRRVRGARRVILYDGFVGFGDASLPSLARSLRVLGYRRVTNQPHGVVAVQMWQKRLR